MVEMLVSREMCRIQRGARDERLKSRTVYCLRIRQFRFLLCDTQCDGAAPSYSSRLLMFTHRGADPLATSHSHNTPADKLPLPRILFLVQIMTIASTAPVLYNRLFSPCSMIVAFVSVPCFRSQLPAAIAVRLPRGELTSGFRFPTRATTFT
jgi:hypothetical protein